MSRKWNPKEFTVAMLGERLDICYSAALMVASGLLDAGMLVEVPRPARAPTGPKARYYKLTARRVRKKSSGGWIDSLLGSMKERYGGRGVDTGPADVLPYRYPI